MRYATNRVKHLCSPRFARSVMDHLLNNMADVEATRNDGYTPLHLAAEIPSENFTKCRLLVAKGASIHAKANGMTPADVAAANGFHDTAAYLANPAAHRMLLSEDPTLPARQAETARNEHRAKAIASSRERPSSLALASSTTPIAALVNANVDTLSSSTTAIAALANANVEKSDAQQLVEEQRAVSHALSMPSSSAGAVAVLDINWALILDQAGILHHLTSMQVSIEASELAQQKLRADNAALDARIASHAEMISKHDKRIRQLEERREVQSAQLHVLRALAEKPNHLLFYRTVLINIEAVFLSCKTISGGFVDLGGDALNSKVLTSAATTVKVCGALLSLENGKLLVSKTYIKKGIQRWTHQKDNRIIGHCTINE